MTSWHGWSNTANGEVHVQESVNIVMSAEGVVQQHAALDLTYVLYNEESHLSHLLAMLTLTPVLLNPAYAALAVYTREIVFVEMWAGQLLCEAFNYVLKHLIREERPNESLGPGYGFPSSHSQWMGYFAAFLICHFAFRHRFASTGSWLLDRARAVIVYSIIVTWAGAVAYSRYHLTYHSARQVLWGVGIGVVFGVAYYTTVELIPFWFPNSILGSLRSVLVGNPLSAWLRVRDGWAVYPDGGMEEQWQAWKQRLDAQQERQHSQSSRRKKIQ
ncbi:PAP2-domain-containing protein [Trametopsis cervina]|nr:PAP2-domain-containing protein [Trametopsis cervina]